MCLLSRRPDVDGLVVAGRGKASLIRRPGDRGCPLTMAPIGVDMLAGEGFPDLHRPVIAGGGHTCSIWRPGHISDTVSMPMIGHDGFLCGCFPDLCRVIRMC